MEEVEITDVDDDHFPYQTQKEPPKNRDLTYLSFAVGELLSQYGWYLLAGTVLLYLLIQHLSRRRTSRAAGSPPPQAEQDAASVARKQEAMEASRQRMQQELDAKAAIFREKQQQQEEEKRRQKIEMWESMQQGRSYKGTTGSQQSPEEAGSSAAAALKPKAVKKPLRGADYNPLTGQGGGSCVWRPGRRGPSSGG